MAGQKVARKTGIPGLKFTISTAAVAATLGGWATLTQQQPLATADAAATAQESSLNADQEAASTQPEWLVNPPAIPTLVPVISSVQVMTSNAQTTVASAAGAATLRTVTAPPAPTASPKRVVTPPVVRSRPRVVARTRSSR